MTAELVQGTTSLRVISNQIKESSGEENLASSLKFTPSKWHLFSSSLKVKTYAKDIGYEK